MDTEYAVVKRFNSVCNAFIKKKIAEEKEIKNTKEKKLCRQKYLFLKRKYKLPYYYELIQIPDISNEFSREDINNITIHLINKIRGIYKHAQAEKTFLCNIDILSSIKLDQFTICITKNTIEANSQWTKRLIKDLKKEFPTRSLAELILVCSSKENTLDGNATHCKMINSVISNLVKHNTFRVLFICSNHTRVEEILELLQAYDGLDRVKQLPIVIQYDEAHNVEDGIPSKREIIENILRNPFIERFTPCSASENPIHDKTNPLWQKENLDNNAFDYTCISSIKSDSPEYSSLHDAVRINFEDIEAHPLFTSHGITAFNLLDFKRVDDHNYDNFRKQQTKIYLSEGYSEDETHIIVEDEVKRDIDRRRQLEFSPFMQGEIKGFNMGLNILDNFYDVTSTPTKLFIPNVKNIHLIQTPNRVVLTYSLMKYAIERAYKPILIGLYRGKINLMYKDNTNNTQEKEYATFSENGSEKELNEKIDEILRYLGRLNININVPIIIMGNYKPTGESITFVNYTYGHLRSVILIPGVSSTSEKDYQSLCRSNYMLTKFLEHNPNFTPPEKFICSYSKNITNALIIEKRNDDRIDELKENQYEDSSTFVPVIHHHESSTTNHENISIPVKIQIEDMDDENIKILFTILNQKIRSEEDKIQILEIFEEGYRNKTITFIDKTGKLNFEKMKIKIVRTYRKKTDAEIQTKKDEMGENYKPHEAGFRIEEYEINHNQNMPYISYKEEIEQNDCQLYACNDRYVHKEFINPRQRMWLSYRY